MTCDNICVNVCLLIGGLKITNEELRKEFEKLGSIVYLLSETRCSYNVHMDLYHGSDDFDDGWINGAWYAYKAQYEKYTKIIKVMTELQDGFDKANEMIRSAKQAAWQAEMQDAALKRGLCVLHVGENVKILLDEQDSNHD